jgi:prepilin-type N-terminal cleavage/methylation domain-containing protein
MTPIRSRPGRPGFTVPELLVAMAVALGIMVILTEAFRTGLDFSRFARATGEMMDQLHGAGVIITRDLQADHFDVNTDKPRLSDQRLDQLTTAGTGWTAPKRGFFRIISPKPSRYGPFGEEQLGPLPLQNADNESFYINTAANHALHFTAILPGGSDQNQFSALVGGNAYVSRAAEIAYFLVPMTGQQTSPASNGRQLYNLIRRQRLVAINDDQKTVLTPAATDIDVISGNGAAAFTLADTTNPANRLTYSQISSNSPHYGEDILLSNVISFEVRVDWTPNQFGVQGSTAGPQAFKTGGVITNSDFPWDYLSSNPQGGGLFETGNTASPPLAIRVKSIQITIRLYDPRVKLVRQNTWTVAM